MRAASMPVVVNELRNFHPEQPVWNVDGTRGPVWDELAARLAEQGHAFTVIDSGGQPVVLKTVEEWKGFLDRHCRTQEEAEKLVPELLGMCWQDLYWVLDGFAASDEKQLAPNLNSLSPVLGLDATPGLSAAAGQTATVPKLDGSTVNLHVETRPALSTALLDVPPHYTSKDQRRNRLEREGGLDFKAKKKAEERAIAAFQAELEKFGLLGGATIDWSKPEIAELISQYELPVIPEFAEGGGVQSTKELFVELHLELQGVELRCRIRMDPVKDASGAKVPDQWRVRRRLVQWKTESSGAVTGDAKQGFEKEVLKSEHRWESFSGTQSTAELNEEMQQLVAVAQGGRMPEDSSVSVGAMVDLVKYLKEKGLLQDGQELTPQPTFYILQERHRSHLWLRDPRNTVYTGDKQTLGTQGLLLSLTDHLTNLNAQKAALEKGVADPTLISGKTLAEVETELATVQAELGRLTPLQAKLQAQFDLQTKVSEVVSRHGSKSMYWAFDYQIESLDPWTSWDANARTGLPLDRRGDDKDTVGLLDDGLHVEVEWDASSSEPLDFAYRALEEKLKATPTDAGLLADKAVLEQLIAMSRKDKMTTLSRLAAAIVAADVEVLDDMKSKDQRARQHYDERRPVYFVES